LLSRFYGLLCGFGGLSGFGGLLRNNDYGF
jgi:hypothetical protein